MENLWHTIKPSISGKLCGGWGRVTELASYYIYMPGLYVENKVPLGILWHFRIHVV